MRWILVALLILPLSISGWGSAAWGESIEGDITLPESESITFQISEAPETYVEFSIKDGKLHIYAPKQDESARVFFEYLQDYVDTNYAIIKKSRLKSILWSAYNKANELYLLKQAQIQLFHMKDSLESDIYKNLTESLERDRQLAQEIDELLKTLEDKP